MNRRAGLCRITRFPLLGSLMLLVSVGLASAQTTVFVSPDGDDANPGSLEQPLRSIEVAFGRAGAGTHVRLLPGRYEGKHRLRSRSGRPDQPIVIIGNSSHPDSAAVLDGGGSADLNQDHACLEIRGVEWLVVQNLAFRNCWTDSIEIEDSGYITFAGNDFVGGRRAIVPDEGAHHILVENNSFEQDLRVWDSWPWDELHHGQYAHFNGAALHPRRSEGGHVMRGNHVENVFNGFRTRPNDLSLDSNIEVYDNTFVNVRDNAIEPESFVWNHHYYRNRLYNSRKSFSVDGIEDGGGVYIWGNVQWQEDNPVLGPSAPGAGRQSISGLWKFRESPLSDTLWIFNNSFYTTGRIWKDLRLPFRNIRHFNNAYQFVGRGEWAFDDVDPSFDLDFDCSNRPPSSALRDAGLAQNAIVTDIIFVSPKEGELRLVDESPCHDAGLKLQIPRFSWTQQFSGAAPDIGAFEDTALVEGPAFRFIPPPGGVEFEEHPRIVRHRVTDSSLVVHFSAPLDSASLHERSVELLSNGVGATVTAVRLGDNGFKAEFQADRMLDGASLALGFDPPPLGLNGLQMTFWASTLPYSRSTVSPTPKPTAANRELPFDAAESDGLGVRVFPNPASSEPRITFSTRAAGAVQVSVFDSLGRRVIRRSEHVAPGRHSLVLDSTALRSGVYFVRVVTVDQTGASSFTLIP